MKLSHNADRVDGSAVAFDRMQMYAEVDRLGRGRYNADNNNLFMEASTRLGEPSSRLLEEYTKYFASVED